MPRLVSDALLDYSSEAKGLEGVEPKLAQKIDALAQSYQMKYGEPLKLTSGHRSLEHQTQLYDADVAAHGGQPSGYVAKPLPGYPHSGRAIDIDKGQAAKIPDAVLAEVGLHRPLRGQGARRVNEPWHLEESPESSTQAGGPVNYLERAKQYTPAQLRVMSDQVADEYGLPKDMFRGLMGHESAGWRADAANPKSSALGIGQFLDETNDAYQLGLKVYPRGKGGRPHPEDERLDPLKAMHAAAKLLLKKPGDTWGERVKNYGEGTDEYLQKVVAYSEQEKSRPTTEADMRASYGLSVLPEPPVKPTFGERLKGNVALGAAEEVGKLGRLSETLFGPGAPGAAAVHGFEQSPLAAEEVAAARTKGVEELMTETARKVKEHPAESFLGGLGEGLLQMVPSLPRFYLAGQVGEAILGGLALRGGTALASNLKTGEAVVVPAGEAALGAVGRAAGKVGEFIAPETTAGLSLLRQLPRVAAHGVMTGAIAGAASGEEGKRLETAGEEALGFGVAAPAFHVAGKVIGATAKLAGKAILKTPPSFRTEAEAKARYDITEPISKWSDAKKLEGETENGRIVRVAGTWRVATPLGGVEPVPVAIKSENLSGPDYKTMDDVLTATAKKESPLPSGAPATVVETTDKKLAVVGDYSITEAEAARWNRSEEAVAKDLQGALGFLERRTAKAEDMPAATEAEVKVEAPATPTEFVDERVTSPTTLLEEIKAAQGKMKPAEVVTEGVTEEAPAPNLSSDLTVGEAQKPLSALERAKGRKASAPEEIKISVARTGKVTTEVVKKSKTPERERVVAEMSQAAEGTEITPEQLVGTQALYDARARQFEREGQGSVEDFYKNVRFTKATGTTPQAALEQKVIPPEFQAFKDRPKLEAQNLEAKLDRERVDRLIPYFHTTEDLQALTSGSGTVTVYHGAPKAFAERIVQSIQTGENPTRWESADAMLRFVADLYNIPYTELRNRTGLGHTVESYRDQKVSHFSTAPAEIASRWATSFPYGEVLSEINNRARIYVEALRQGKGFNRFYDTAWKKYPGSDVTLADRMHLPDKLKEQRTGGALVALEVDVKDIPNRFKTEAKHVLESGYEDSLIVWNTSYKDIKIDPAKIKSAKIIEDLTPQAHYEVPYKYQGQEQIVHGYTEVDTASGKAIIGLYRAANFSTLVHEAWHLFEMTLPHDLTLALEDWHGKPLTEWKLENYETTARAFERFWAEGRVGQKELKEIGITGKVAKVFAQFKEWLLNVYKGIKDSDIDVQINTELENIFRKALGLAEKTEVLPEVKPSGKVSMRTALDAVDLKGFPEDAVSNWAGMSAAKGGAFFKAALKKASGNELAEKRVQDIYRVVKEVRSVLANKLEVEAATPAGGEKTIGKITQAEYDTKFEDLRVRLEEANAKDPNSQEVKDLIEEVSILSARESEVIGEAKATPERELGARYEVEAEKLFELAPGTQEFETQRAVVAALREEVEAKGGRLYQESPTAFRLYQDSGQTGNFSRDAETLSGFEIEEKAVNHEKVKAQVANTNATRLSSKLTQDLVRVQAKQKGFDKSITEPFVAEVRRAWESVSSLMEIDRAWSYGAAEVTKVIKKQELIDLGNAMDMKDVIKVMKAEGKEMELYRLIYNRVHDTVDIAAHIPDITNATPRGLVEATFSLQKANDTISLWHRLFREERNYMLTETPTEKSWRGVGAFLEGRLGYSPKALEKYTRAAYEATTNMQHAARRWPVLKPLFELGQRREATTIRLKKLLFGGDPEADVAGIYSYYELAGTKPSVREAVDAILLKADADAKSPKLTPEVVVGMKEVAHLSEADKQLASQVIGDIRQTLDYTYNRLRSDYEANLDQRLSPTVKAKKMKTWDEEHAYHPNYFPHMREGSQVVMVKDSLGNTMYSTRTDSGREAVRLKDELKRKYPKMTVTEFTAEPGTSAGVSGAFLQQFVSNIEARAAEVGEEVGKFREIADRMIKEFGLRGHYIARESAEGIPGFETNVGKALIDYTNLFSSHVGKMEFLRGAFDEISSLKGYGRVQDYARKWVELTLRPSNKMDDAIATAKNVAFLKYIGGSFKTAVVTTFDKITNAYPMMGMYVKNPGELLLGGYRDGVKFWKWERDVGKYMRDAKAQAEAKGQPFNAIAVLREAREGVGLPKGLEKWEVDGLLQLRKTGQLDAVFTHVMLEQHKHRFEAMGEAQKDFVTSAEGYLKRGWDKTLEWGGKLIGTTESYGRSTTALSAMRMFKQLGYAEADAVAAAGRFMIDAHGYYGKMNLPLWMMKDVGKLAKLPYTFRVFEHHYLELIGSMLLGQQGKAGRLAAAKSLGLLAGLGGMMSLPFFTTASKLFRASTGTDPEQYVRKQLNEIDNSQTLADLFSYGIPAGTIGLDMPAISLRSSTEMGRIKPEELLLGAPGSLFTDVRKGTNAALEGDWHNFFDAVMPTALRNPTRAYERYYHGALSATGKRLTEGPGGPQIKYSAGEAVGQALGFAPSKMEKYYQQSEVALADKEFWASKRKALYSRLQRAFNKGDEEGINKVFSDVEAYNSRAAALGPDIVRITPQEIRQSLKDRIQRKQAAQAERLGLR